MPNDSPQHAQEGKMRLSLIDSLQIAEERGKKDAQAGNQCDSWYTTPELRTAYEKGYNSVPMSELPPRLPLLTTLPRHLTKQWEWGRPWEEGFYKLPFTQAEQYDTAHTSVLVQVVEHATTIARLEEQIKNLRRQNNEMSWTINPERMGR